MNNDLITLLEQNKIVKTSDIVKLGISKPTIAEYVKKGLIVKIAHGLYSLKDEITDEMLLLSLKSEKMIFSHESALFLNDLSDRTPFVHTVTIKSGESVSKFIKDECKCHYVKKELFSVGLTEKKTTLGNFVKCYNAERTICDLLRNRNRCDEESVVSAVKNYVLSKDKNLNLLAEYSVVFKIEDKIRMYMEVLL